MLRTQSSTQRRSRTLTIWWIHKLLPSIASVLNHLLLSYETWILKKKRVNVGSSIFFFLKCSPFVGMTTKFNQGMYARMRAKKNEPLSNRGTKGVRVMEKGILITTATPSTPVVESARTASLATSIEEIPPQWSKRQRTGDK